MNRLEEIQVLVDEVYLEKGDITVAPRSRGVNITLRRFQDELVRVLGVEYQVRYIGLEAPTGGGKTLTALAPLLSNILFETEYNGVVGVYPTKPLVNDQFLSLRDTLDKLGRRISELRGSDGLEVAVKYNLDLAVVDGKLKNEKVANVTVGLVRLTRESLNKLQESLENTRGRLSLLDLIRKTFIDAHYLIAVAVPEYPFLMLSSLYRSAPDAHNLLSLVAQEGCVYNLARKIASSSPEKVDKIISTYWSELTQLLQSKTVERERLNIYSALFSEVMFLDEFHTWTMYERPTVLALVLLHYLESLRTAMPERYKVIFSSATPQNELYEILKKLNLGEVRMVKGSPAAASTNAHRVKSKIVVRFIPRQTKPTSGPISWFKVEEHIPDIVKELAGEIKSKERAIIFGRRNATVEQAAEAFHEATGEEPAVVTGVRTRFPGKELLEQRKESGKLFVFGNYSIELGIDLRKIPFGVVHGVYVGEVVQRLGRIGRGDVEQAEAVIPIPKGYEQTVKRLVGKSGGRMSYTEFVKLLWNILPKELGVEVYGTEFIMKHKVGKLRLYLPLATYVLMMVRQWEYEQELGRLCRRFVEIVDALEIPSIFQWLGKVSKSADVLVPIASFRLAVSLPYTRNGIEDYASLSTLLGNYEVRYADGKLAIEGVSRKNLQSELLLVCRYLARDHYDMVLPSNTFLDLTKDNISGNTVIYNILKNHPIPLYIASHEEDYEVFNAFGYAIRVKLAMEEKSFYLLIL